LRKTTAKRYAYKHTDQNNLFHQTFFGKIHCFQWIEVNQPLHNLFIPDPKKQTGDTLPGPPVSDYL
jgi:hypothetical protein